MHNIIKYSRILISAILIWLVLAKVDFSESIDLLHHTKYHYIILLLLMIAFEQAVMAHKWNLLLKAKGIYIPFVQIFKIMYIGTFLGSFLPSSFSVDAFRGYGLFKVIFVAEESISSVIVDRALGLTSLIILAAVSSVLYISCCNGARQLNITILLIVIILLLLTVLIVCVYFLIDKNITRFQGESGLMSNMKKVCSSLRSYKGYPTALVKGFFLSVIIQVITVLVYFVASLNFGSKIDLMHFFILVPILKLMLVLPFSLAGIGIREGAFVYLFSGVGMSPSLGLAVSLLVSILVIISILPGGIFYATSWFSDNNSSVQDKKRDHRMPRVG